jgi:SAM-dependent methyltransferase
VLIRLLKARFRWLNQTPLHPQWLLGLGSAPLLEALRSCAGSGGWVLDVGCATQWPRQYLHPESHYLGLDYPVTAIDWYHTRPQIFGDASQLPIASDSVDAVLLLDVLEHLADPVGALAETWRVIKPGGALIAQVPMLYPLHDEPRDFQRLTAHGLRLWGERQGFSVETLGARGQPLETAAVLGNIALAKAVINGVNADSWGQKLAALPLFIVALIWIPVSNMLAWGLSRVLAQDDFMPFSYLVVLRKPDRPK